MADKKISALTGATTPLAGTEVLPIVQGGSTVKVSIADVTAGRAVSAAQLDVDNVRVDGNTISTTDTNGNLTIDPNGSGYTIISAATNGTIAHIGDLNSRTFYVKQTAAGGFDNDTLVFESDSGVGQFQWKNSGATLWSMNRFGNLAPATAGTGIDFSANTHAAGMTSELLNDYEEGTWTPTDASGAGLSLTVTAATYTKIGRMVYASLNITYPATANGSTLLVGGLPFVSKNAGSVTIAYTNQGTAISGSTSPADDTFFALYKYDGTILVNSDMSGKILRATVIYQSA
jgi:hypothetical protein